MHLNDSKAELGSKKDRHHSLGESFIGSDCFKYIAADSRFNGVPMVLETVNPDIWDKEIVMLKGFAK